MGQNDMLQNIISNTIGHLLGAAIGALSVLYLRFYMNRAEKGATKQEMVLDIKNKTHRPTMVVFLYALAILQIAWSVALLTIVPLIDHYLQTSEYEEMPLKALLMLLFMGVVMIIVSAYVAHRLRNNRTELYVGLILATFCLTVIEISILTGEFPTADLEGFIGLLMLFGFSCITLLPGVALGRFIAQKTQLEFTMNQLFRRLPLKDKKELIELVDSLPSIATKKG